MQKKHKIIAITGPSASGKTGIAIELAKRINGEIISADSRLIYKEFDIATAKPTEVEKQGIEHHLIDIIEPTEKYSVANFLDDANKAIKEILKKGKTPIVAGGTGLYFRVLLEHLDLPRVAPNKELREELEKKSCEELYSMLMNLDEEIASKIHKNNKVKIIRALEVAQTLKIPMSQAQKTKESDYETLWIGLNAKNRQFIYDRINLRVDNMLKSGLIEEAKTLFNKYPNLEILSNTIGYQELKDYFENKIELNDAIEQIKQNTRRYAKRQLSWFRANKDINWFNIDEMPQDEILKNIEEKWSNTLLSQSYS